MVGSGNENIGSGPFTLNSAQNSPGFAELNPGTPFLTQTLRPDVFQSSVHVPIFGSWPYGAEEILHYQTHWHNRRWIYTYSNEVV